MLARRAVRGYSPGVNAPATIAPDRRPPGWVAPLVLAGLVLACFVDLLIAPDGRIASASQTDLTLHFAASRDFGFGEIARGNFPLWNPRMFSGYPYFGGFQPALLYPLNWPFALLPLGLAINLNIALHVFLAGYFVYVWLRRDCGDLAALTAGAAFMFGARYFLHVYAGHLPHLCLVPWLAMLLWSIDGLCRDGRMAWSLVAAWASAMMLLAGYPQMLYFALLVLPIYAAGRWAASGHKAVSAGGMALAGVLAMGLCTAQVWAGIEAARESTRRDGTDYAFAATFSFPPENLLTLVAPDALGKLPESVGTSSAPYFGQAYLWETSTWIGVGMTLLAVVGVVGGGRAAAMPLTLVIVTAVLGLGANTPVHRWMFDWFPGFSSFRGSSKFFYLTSLFMVQLGAIGFAALRRDPRRWWPIVVAGGMAVLLVMFGLAVRASAETGPEGAFARALKGIAQRGIARGDYYYAGGFPQEPPERSNFDEPVALRLMGRTSAWSFWIAGAWALSAGAALAVARYRPGAGAILLASLVMGEGFAFARGNRPTAPLEAELPPVWQDALRELGTVNRFVRNLSEYDYRGELSDRLDAWGYDPGMLDRYARVLCVSQGQPPDSAVKGLFFRREAPAVFRLARIDAVLLRQPHAVVVRPSAVPLPPALIVPHAIVMSGDEGRDAILSALTHPAFDPSSTVLLEEEPAIRPSGAPGPSRPAVEWRVIDTDTRRIRTDLPAPAVLLITEAYSRHWVARARADIPEGQGEYRVMPGNGAFIAIPLSAGRHEFELAFAPRGWVVGRWVSLVSLLAFVGLSPWIVRSLLPRR